MVPQTVQNYIDAGGDVDATNYVSSPLVGMTVGVGAKVGSESSSGSGFALADERQCLLHCLELLMSGSILVLGWGGRSVRVTRGVVCVSEVGVGPGSGWACGEFGSK